VSRDRGGSERHERPGTDAPRDTVTGASPVGDTATGGTPGDDAPEAPAQYRELFEGNPIPMWVYDTESLQFLEVNDAAVAHYGYSRPEFFAMTIADIRPPEDGERFRAHLERTEHRPSDELDAAGVWRHRRADGSIIEVEITAHRVEHRGRQAELVVARDVTAQRGLEAAARLHVARLTAIVDATRHLGTATRTLDDVYDEIPTVVHRVLDCPVAALLLVEGDRIVQRSVVGVENVTVSTDREGSPLGLVLEAGRTIVVNDLTAYPGARLDLAAAAGIRSVLVTPLHDAARPVGVVIAGSDRVGGFDEADARTLDLLVHSLDAAVQRSVAEEHRTRAQRLEAVGQLTGGVAHDFNNLLTVILGNSEMLAADLQDDDHLRIVEMTAAAARRGAELAQRLLAFARRQPLEPSGVDVNQLLDTMHSLIRRTLPEDIEFRCALEPALWPAFVDPAQLESAVLNLCLNARDAIAGTGRLTIETANTHLDAGYAATHLDVVPGEYVLLAVSDTGAGIDPTILDRVIEPFFTTKRFGAGSGLGLSMVHGFVKQSGGHLSIYSEVGQGTTVKLYLPRSDRVDPGVEVDPDPSDLRGTERVLVAEDDEHVRRVASEHLRRLGYDVTEASDGAEALGIIEGGAVFDLLFTDVVMPGGLSGRQLADAAQTHLPGLRVLFTSGYTENAIVHHGRLDPGVELLAKPYGLSELARRVRTIVDGA
jgi:PAS domain S-box-containing protein